MAVETGVQDVPLRHQRERTWDGRFAAPRFHVPFGRSVTPFTSGALRRFLTGRDAFVVRVLVKVGPHVGVACFANRAADVFGRGWRRWIGCLSRLSSRRYRKNREDKKRSTCLLHTTLYKKGARTRVNYVCAFCKIRFNVGASLRREQKRMWNRLPG